MTYASTPALTIEGNLDATHTTPRPHSPPPAPVVELLLSPSPLSSPSTWKSRSCGIGPDAAGAAATKQQSLCLISTTDITPTTTPSSRTRSRPGSTLSSSTGRSNCYTTSSSTTTTTTNGTGTKTTTGALFGSRKEYMASLVPPSSEEFEKISLVQQEREAEIKELARQRRRWSLASRQESHDNDALSRQDSPSSEGGSETRRRRIEAFRFKRAAKVIQRTYRGYRTRQESKGIGLDASTRWMAAIKEAQFRETTRPRARSAALPGAGSSDEEGGSGGVGGGGGRASSELVREEDGFIHRGSTARENWRKAAIIARRAGHDDEDSDSPALSPIPSSESGGEDTPEKQEKRRKMRTEAVAKRKEDSMMMGLQYFLEMVDPKHRYGSNLRAYHEEWKKQDTNENFFYWLDEGAGRNVDMAVCPRDRLDRERVRYLSREERQYYLVTVDGEGRLCWAKNGQPIDTTERYKDSVDGIVPLEDPTPAWTHPDGRPATPRVEDDSRSESSIESAREADRAAKYADPEFDEAPAHRKVLHVSAGTIFNKLLRKSVRKNTWIFVADTNFRLYVGIKSSGAFQHSSFLQGSRISAAGLIKIKEGRLASLSPLSGHYRPPASNFRAFIRSLKEAGVDVSHVSISKAYTVLVGLETYVRTRQKGKHVLERLTAKKEKIVAPEAVAQREEDARDKSESAEKERQVLEQERLQEEQEREANKPTVKVMKKLGVVPTEPAEARKAGDEEDPEQAERA